MSEEMMEIEQDRLRSQLISPKCHPMADNFDEESEVDGSDDEVVEGEEG